MRSCEWNHDIGKYPTTPISDTAQGEGPELDFNFKNGFIGSSLSLHLKMKIQCINKKEDGIGDNDGCGKEKSVCGLQI